MNVVSFPTPPIAPQPRQLDRWRRSMLNRIDAWRLAAGERASLLGADAQDFAALDEIARRLRDRAMRR